MPSATAHHTGRVVIVGPGAVGAVLAGAFVAGGCEVSLLGRPGPHLDAIASDGLRLRSADAAELATPELAVVCVKSQDLPAAVRNLQSWLDGGTDLLIAVNGVPWRRSSPRIRSPAT
jgi:2-dehydropantoate 2-reductase